MELEEDTLRGSVPGKTSLAYWFAPLFLCLVSATHLYQVKVRGQTPWIGGGFGMFASLEGPGSRLIEITLETTIGNIAVAPPQGPLDGLYTALRVLPSETNLRRYGEALMGLDWALETPRPAVSSLENLALPAAEKTETSPIVDPTPRLRAGATGDRSTGIEVRAVTLRLWQYRFELETRRVRMAPRLEVRVDGSAP